VFVRFIYAFALLVLKGEARTSWMTTPLRIDSALRLGAGKEAQVSSAAAATVTVVRGGRLRNYANGSNGIYQQKVKGTHRSVTIWNYIETAAG
jgi:hypothetical protein